MRTGAVGPRWKSRVMDDFPSDQRTLVAHPPGRMERARKANIEPSHPFEIRVDVADEGD